MQHAKLHIYQFSIENNHKENTLRLNALDSDIGGTHSVYALLI